MADKLVSKLSNGTDTYVIKDANAYHTGDLATVATTGDYDDLIDKPTIGNATLTIQKNSTTVDTFTANATVDKTINITVPTTAADVNAVAANTAITGATKCKITYDSKGLVTAGADLQASDIPDLSSTYQAKLVSGTNIKTVNNNSLLGSGDISIIGLPSQASQSGKFLTTDGTDASWATVDALPSQSGQSGKFLTTDGSSASWATVSSGSSTLSGLSDTSISSPSSGQLLKYNGSSWENASVTIPTTTDSITSGSSAALTSGGAYTNVVTGVAAHSTDSNKINVTKAGSTSTITIDNVSNATTATKVGSTTVGGSTTPIYLNNGTPTALSYTIAKSVPSDAVFTDTTYSVFTGANGSTAGTSGLVKAPAAADNTKFLRGDCTWATVDSLPSQTGNNGKFLTTNGSTTSWGEALVNGPTNTGSLNLLGDQSDAYNSVNIGSSSSIGSTKYPGYTSIAIGYNAKVKGSGDPITNAIQLGEGTNTTYNSFQVWSYQLLNGTTGKIPDDRLNNPIPSQTGNSGKFLTTNGTAISWETVDALPSQTGQSGKFLTTDGSAASWANAPTELPTQSGQSGKFLTTDGSAVSWASVSQTLSGLTDTTISSASDGQVLTYDSSTSKWVNQTQYAMVITDYTA